MKVIQFTIPVSTEHSIIVQEDVIPYFYDHLHRHHEIQITLVLQGEGALIAGNYMQPFKSGDIYIIGSNQAHIFKSDPGMNDVYQYTMAHYAEEISLNDIAKIACLTPQAFCRYFKTHTRKTYVCVLNEIRINEACKMIISGNLSSISSIAYDTGFSSAVSFNRVFKKITSKSPREFLKEYSQKVG